MSIEYYLVVVDNTQYVCRIGNCVEYWVEGGWHISNLHKRHLFKLYPTTRVKEEEATAELVKHKLLT